MIMSDHSYQRYTTQGGVQVNKHTCHYKNDKEFARRLPLLDNRSGVLLSCRSEYPGRYRPRDILVVNPPLSLTAKEQALTIRALNARGRILLPGLQQMFGANADIRMSALDDQIQLQKNNQASDNVSEEMRTRRSGLFDLLRLVISYFASGQDEYLGLYGAFA